MAEPTPDAQLEGFLEIRKPGAHLEEDVVPDDFVLMLGVDLDNYPKFPSVDDGTTYPKADLDVRQQVDVDSGAELPDYSGPYRADLRYTDFSVTRWPPVPPVERGVPRALRRRMGRRDRTPLRRRHDGRDRVGGVERPGRPRARTHARRVPPRGPDLRRPQPAGRRGRPREDPRRLHRTLHPAARDHATSPSPSSSPGSSGATSTCCSASRDGRPRSWCATAST